MTLAVEAKAYGGPDVLALVEEEVPEPGPGEVQLEVRAAGVNPADVKRYSGQFGSDPAALPLRLGYEAAGVVTAVGPDAVGPLGPISRGDEVVAFRVVGAYAQRLNVRADTVLPKPARLPWPDAGGLLLAGVTAVHALTATAVSAGDTVLVHAAAGGVGVMAVQLAVLRGARVIGTAGAANHDFLRELGAEPVGYGPGLVERVRALAPGGVSAALDLVGSDEAVDSSLQLVADPGRIATIAAFGRGARTGIRMLGGMAGSPGVDPGTELRAAARPELLDLAGSGQLRVIVQQTFPLTQVAEAHRRILTGHTRGKLVLLG